MSVGPILIFCRYYCGCEHSWRSHLFRSCESSGCHKLGQKTLTPEPDCRHGGIMAIKSFEQEPTVYQHPFIQIGLKR
jgi:hypothetical protein